MTHRATPAFWECYSTLPPGVKESADKAFELLKTDLKHPALHFKKMADSGPRASDCGAVRWQSKPRVLWFWNGTHAEYDRLIH